jgi:hypothetical protein
MIAKPWSAEERAGILRELGEVHEQRSQALDREDWDSGSYLFPPDGSYISPYDD